MSKQKWILAALMAASLFAPIDSRASEPRAVACSVVVNYLLNNVVRAPYQKEFVLNPGVPFSDDFSTATRFRYFDASARFEADTKSTIVSISYFNDVGVFETVDFSTELKLDDAKAPASTSGTHTYWSSLGVAGSHTTSYELTCQVQKD